MYLYCLSFGCCFGLSHFDQSPSPKKLVESLDVGVILYCCRIRLITAEWEAEAALRSLLHRFMQEREQESPSQQQQPEDKQSATGGSEDIGLSSVGEAGAVASARPPWAAGGGGGGRRGRGGTPVGGTGAGVGLHSTAACSGEEREGEGEGEEDEIGEF